ncbi:MAG: PIN domain-containing protein [Aquificales bacterium]|nr:PIN domain-containing protein [Aquificales bacterium]
MVLGADTGFFIARAQNHPQATAVWQKLMGGKHELVVSTVTINELLVYYFKRGQGEVGEKLVSLMIRNKFVNLVPVSVEIAQLSARYRHGVGLPTVDSLILATCLDRKCDKLLSTDSDFRIVHEQSIIPVEFLE